MIIGEQSITYYNGSVHHCISMKLTIMECYSFIEDSKNTILLADHMGQLYCLTLIDQDSKITDMTLDVIGQVSLFFCSNNRLRAHQHYLFLLMGIFLLDQCMVTLS